LALLTWAVGLVVWLLALLPHGAPVAVQPTLVPTIAPAPANTPLAPIATREANGFVTNYGEAYEDLPLGCPGYGVYHSADATIAASAYDLATGARAFQCGTVLELCGVGGCQVVIVKDACPGCAWNQLDLSEAAKVAVCGDVRNNCAVSIERR
jgi:hypothetical protein